MDLRALVSRLSISTRLTLWFGTSLLVLLTLFVAGLYASVHLGLHDDLEARLREETQAVRAHLRAHDFRAHDKAPPTHSSLPSAHAFQAAPGTFVRLLGPNGEVIQASPAFQSRPALPADLPGSRTSTLQSRTWGQTSAQSLYLPLDPKSQSASWLEVTKLQSPIHRQLHALRWWLVLGIVGGVGIAMLVGYGLARRALRPVAALTTAAAKMQDRPTGTLPTDFGVQDELTDLAETFNGLLRRLREALQRERRFRADAAHKMFTPLTAIQNEIDVTLRSDRPASAYRETLATVRTHTDELSSMLDQLMALSRAEAREAGPAPASVDGAERVRERAEHVRPRADEAGVGLSVEADASAPVPVHADHFDTIVDHLLDNALKYTPEGGTVEASVRQHDDAVVLRVADTGIGFAPDEADRLFDRFYRGAAADDAARGGGLGLSVVQALVHSYEGSVTAQSEGPGTGSTFVVELPTSHNM